MNQTQQESISKVTTCRACKGTAFKSWLNLGDQPLANNLLSAPTDAENFYPLAYMYCTSCGLVQTTHTVSPDLLFKKYLYYSSTSEVFRKHFTLLAEKEFNFDKVMKNDLVVDIGSNDGILLKPFKEKGARVLGIEPAGQIANDAAKSGIETLPEYFTTKLAGFIREQYGEATLITMTNVFAHVPDLDEIISGVKYLLADNGRFMVEVAYLPDMLKYGTFDLLYHEHVCSWHLSPMQRFFERHGMYIDETEFVPVHGGSIRVYAKVGKLEKSPRLNDYGLEKTKEFLAFPQRIKTNKEAILKLLAKLKKERKHIIGYGAPAKMSTMTNYFDIGPDMIDYIIEDAPAKQHMYSPGKHIKIVPPVTWEYNTETDYLFIFAWNFAESIIKSCRARGFKGRFIIPFPNVKVL